MRGQVIIEYFLLFVVVAMLTLLGFTRFDDDVRSALERFFVTAANRMAR